MKAFPCETVTGATWVAPVAQVRSLAHELPHDRGEAKKKKKIKKKTEVFKILNKVVLAQILTCITILPVPKNEAEMLVLLHGAQNWLSEGIIYISSKPFKNILMKSVLPEFPS